MITELERKAEQLDGMRMSLSGIRARDGSLANQVYETLKEAILSFAYPPGTVIRKATICYELQVSRAPVAEALARLSAESLVDIVPQSGTKVTLISLDEIREAAFLREALETAAVAKVARERTPDQLRQLSRNIRLQKMLVDDQDFDGFYEADEEFHDSILAYTGFKRVAATVETVSLQITRARRLLLPTPGRAEETLAEHIAIFEAIEEKRPAAAQKAMRGHLAQLIERLEPLQKEMPHYFLEAGATS